MNYFILILCLLGYLFLTCLIYAIGKATFAIPYPKDDFISEYALAAPLCIVLAIDITHIFVTATLYASSENIWFLLSAGGMLFQAILIFILAKILK